jgi:hypothetical protein
MILPIALGDKRANPKYRIALVLYDGTNKDLSLLVFNPAANGSCLLC